MAQVADFDEYEDLIRQARIDDFILDEHIRKFKRENIPPQHWRD